MAAPIDDDELVYAAVSNIPIKLHSKHLRNYFSQFLEAGGFDCFHFKHRPERKVTEKPDFIEWCRNELDATVIDVAAKKAETQFAHAHNTDMTDDGHDGDTVTSRTFDEDKVLQQGFPRQPLQYSQSDRTTNKQLKKDKARKGNSQDAESKTLCCVIRLYESKLKDLMQMYNKKHWIDEQGNTISQLCIISRIRVAVTLDMVENGGIEQPSNLTTQKKSRRLEAQTIGDAFPLSSLMKLEELNPPDIMPKGNVGTPTAVFNELIRECRLPPKVITRLGIVFPKSRTNKRYGNVPLQYSGEVLPGKERDTLVLTASGHAIYNTDDDSAIARKLMKKTEPHWTKKEQSGLKRDCDDPWPEEDEEDDDSGEEWERHEALHNDVTNQERTTERLFENDMEVTWDKGSSGLVFYTDAAYWDKAEGDFDEKTSDDWDIDMSGYYDPNGGDMDARASLDMRRQRAMKLGLETTSVFKSRSQRRKERREAKECRRSEKINRRRQQRTQDMEPKEKPIGDFEKHTKGIGRKLMEAQGWVEGEGLGKTVKGMSQALDNIGQKMHDKRGFGYYGKKLNPKPQSTIGQPYQQSSNREFIISTVYDDPKVTDPAEPLLRSQGPYHLKFREEVQFTKGSAEADYPN